MEEKKHIIFLILVVALLVKVAVFAFVNVASYIEDSNRIKTLKKQIQQIEEKNSWLKYQIKNASTDAFIEKHAREDLMLAKKGETIIYFKFDKPEDNENKTKKGSNVFEKMLDKLLHLFQK